jgi:excisionase family DNA binding protein
MVAQGVRCAANNSYVAFISFMGHDDLRTMEASTIMLAHRQLAPSAQDAAIARLSGQTLSLFARQNRPLTLRVKDAEQEKPIELPAGAVALLVEILGAMAAGRGVTIIPENAELTTVQAAEVLNVSRPFLIKLLADGAIAHRKVGKHRRVRMEDVMAYKTKIDEQRSAVLDQLARDAQTQGMGYTLP